MRKILNRLIIAAACVGVSLPAIAETHYVPRISIGGHAGVSLSSISFSPSVEQSMLLGTTGAISVRYTEENLFGLVAEFGWSQRGWKENFEGAPISYSRTLTYINLPVMTHIYFGSKRFKGFVNLGPEIAYMIGDNIKSDFNYFNPSAEPDFPQKGRQTAQMAMEIHNKFDYGIVGGLGMEWYLSPRNSFTLEARYYFGLGNIYPSSKADLFSASRCTSIEITLGYNFRLK